MPNSSEGRQPSARARAAQVAQNFHARKRFKPFGGRVILRGRTIREVMRSERVFVGECRQTAFTRLLCAKIGRGATLKRIKRAFEGFESRVRGCFAVRFGGRTF